MLLMGPSKAPRCPKMSRLRQGLRSEPSATNAYLTEPRGFIASNLPENGLLLNAFMQGMQCYTNSEECLMVFTKFVLNKPLEDG